MSDMEKFTRLEMFALGQLAERHRVADQIAELRDKQGVTIKEILIKISRGFKLEKTDFQTFMDKYMKVSQ